MCNALKPVQIDWVKGDTTESIKYLASGDADIAITYNDAAETRAMNLEIAIKKEPAFRDHFYLVGPPKKYAPIFYALCPSLNYFIIVSVKIQRSLMRTIQCLTC